jgi:D-xylose 1-dehydrogenase (NADP+, D-xylono-1,5-lactone-forming)
MSGVQTSPSPKNEDVVNWGILGAAKVAKRAVGPGIQRSPNGVIHAIASRSLEKARDYASTFGVPEAYGSYDELLKDPKVQAVYIPLPNTLHKEWTIRAAEAGKHVLCEKPLASNAAEAQEMVDACRRNDVLLMEAFQYRLHPQTQAVKKIIDEGRIGKVVAVASVHSSSRPEEGNIRMKRELGGGPLADKGCYCVSIARLLMDGEPTSVFARGDFDKDGLDWRVTADLEFQGGRMAWLDTSHKLVGGSYYQGCQIFGEKGRIYIPLPFAQRPVTEQGRIVDTSFVVSSDESMDSVEEKVNVKGVHQWQLEVEYFADRILKSEPLGYPMEDGLAQTKVMDAIYKSAREGGRPERI